MSSQAVVSPARSPSTLANESAPELVLRWLVPLRFLAVAGQVAALSLAAFVLELPLPYAALSLVPALTLLSNLVLWRVPVRADRAPGVAAGVLVFDTLLFTLLLYLSGGPDNPFSAIYAIHVAMAAMIGSPRTTWLVAALSAAGYAFIFFWHEQQHFWHGPVSEQLALPLHAVGMWVAVAVVAVVLTTFIGRITRTLREREEALLRIREIAARNARLASLTTLAAGAAHELGSPLGTIAVIAGDVAREAESTPGFGSLAEDARLLRSEVARCRAILDRMSGRAERAGEETLEPLRAEDVADLLGPDALGAAAGRVDLKLAAPSGARLGSRADFAAVLVPLVRNAIEASPADSRVRVEVGVDVGIDRRRVRVCVRDEGHGMDAETLARAGEPFFTTRPPGRGTGLGLFVVRLHAERLGGTLRLASVPGRGTNAEVEWPTDELA